MSNTISCVSKFDYIDDSVTISTKPSRTFTITTTSDLATDNRQSVGTTHEALSAGDVTDTAWAELECLHATATVSYGYDTAGSFTAIGSFKAGDPPVRLGRIAALASTYLKSDTASTIVRVILCKIA